MICELMSGCLVRMWIRRIDCPKRDHIAKYSCTVVEIVGGEGTPYFGGVFKLEIKIPERFVLINYNKYLPKFVNVLNILCILEFRM